MLFGLLGRNAPALTERPYSAGALTVTDPEVRTRLEFLQVTAQDLGVIRTWEPVCRAACDSMIDAFYAHIARTRQTQAIIDKHTSVDRQRPMVTRYVLAMFSGTLDDAYVEYRRVVGKVHERIDLDSNWYVAMYEVIREHMLAAVERGGANALEYRRFQRAFDRVLQADVAIVVTALTDSRQERVEALLKGEAMRFLDEVSAALSRMANGDLGVRLRGAYTDRNAEVQAHFNDALDSLSHTMDSALDSADEILNTSAALRQSSGVLADGASNQAASLEEVAASLQELTSMSQQSRAHTTEALSLADESRTTAAAGLASMQQLSESMRRIKAGADATAKIIKTIDEIAFQTNLLALNAAVEAARAGDAGRGFAVVADEVRSLALRSAEAARNTAGLIEESVRGANEGASLNEAVFNTLATIARQAERVSGAMSEVATANAQQTQGVEQITIAVEQINIVTQTVAANAEEGSAAAVELRDRAEQLAESIGQFTTDSVTTGAPVGTSGSPTATPRPPGPAPTTVPPRGRSTVRHGALR